jgi:hypothetical protein
VFQQSIIDVTRRVLLIPYQVHCQIAGPDSSFAAKCLLNLGQLQMKAGQIDSAEANVREALAMYEHMFPDSDSIEIARSRHFLALVLKEKRSYEDAVQMLRSSRSVYRTLSKWIHVAISCREQRYVLAAIYGTFAFIASI